uniref:Sulfotransferase family protein n=1 Tax=Ditylenchus dipsaci TaxID=166011 RepID=A0A915EBJ8_9BILA
MCAAKFGSWTDHHYAVAPSKQTAVCRIQKNMSTVLDSLICFLYDEKKFNNISNKSFSGNARQCGDLIDSNSIAKILLSNRITSEQELFKAWNFFALVRDPIDKFLSAFLDNHPIETLNSEGKVETHCNACKSNMTCFIIKEYERIIKASALPKHSTTSEDIHFFPQSWRCELDKFLPNITIIKYNNNFIDADKSRKFQRDIISALSKNKLISKSSLNYISEQLDVATTIHITANSMARTYLEKR